MVEKYTVHPSNNISGITNVPGDKSISHRALILLSISEGTGNISGLLESEDCLATLNIFKMLGVKIEKIDKNSYSIQGKGLYGLKETKKNLDCGNSGTSMRLLAGLLSAQKFSSNLVGDSSLNKRPMERISIPLTRMGANINLSDNKTAPIKINGTKKILPIEYKMPIDSAQIKSSIILASLYADSETKIIENNPTRDHTENMVNFLNGNIVKVNNKIIIDPKTKLISRDINIPGDISSAMFIIVACLISKNSEILIQNVGLNNLRTGGLDILKLMGAQIYISNIKNFGPEKFGDIKVISSKLRGIVIPKKYVASSIDEFPILFIAAANASGKTVLRNAEELRYKESDRLDAMSQGLSSCNIAHKLFYDGIEIEGGEMCGATVNSFDDHRVAMSFLIAGISAKEPITVLNTKNILTSFPDFYSLMKDAGVNIIRENN